MKQRKLPTTDTHLEIRPDPHAGEQTPIAWVFDAREDGGAFEAAILEADDGDQVFAITLPMVHTETRVKATFTFAIDPHSVHGLAQVLAKLATAWESGAFAGPIQGGN